MLSQALTTKSLSSETARVVVHKPGITWGRIGEEFGKKVDFALFIVILCSVFVALQVFYVFRLYYDADRKYEILKRNVTEPIFDFYLEGNDGLIICPPGILLRDWSPLNYVEYTGRDKDPRKSIFGKEALYAVLIIVPFSTDHCKGFDKHNRTLHFYGGNHDSKPVREKFHGSIAKSTHKTKLENEVSNNKVDVVCLSRAREMSSIYPGDPILHECKRKTGTCWRDSQGDSSLQNRFAQI